MITWFGRDAWRAVLPGWIVARLLVALGFVVTDAFITETGITPPLHFDEGLVTWDGTFYEKIAADGYGDTASETLRFFPLYPLLGRMVDLAVGDTGLALVLVANLAALGAMAALRGLVHDETQDPELANRASWYLALFPAAGCLVFAYSESLFLLGSLVYLGAVRRHRWLVATVAGVAVGLVRPVAVLLVIATLLMLRAEQRSARGVPPPALAGPVAAILAPLVGAGAYLGWVGAVFGDWLEPARLQSDLRGGFRFPWARLVDGGFEVAREAQHDGPNLAFAAIFIVLLVIVWRRFPVAWTAYAGASLAVALCAQNLDSVGRYGLAAFPLVVGLAAVTTSPRVASAATAACAGGLVAITAMTLAGGYTP